MVFEGPIYIHGTAPLRSRLESRKRVGPHSWIPRQQGAAGIGFYPGSGLSCGDGVFNLRLRDANDFLGHSRLGLITGYYCDDDGGDTIRPIVARLNHNRGFLVGWTMGEHMASSLQTDTIYKDAESAARAAHQDAEYAAEREREYQERERIISEQALAESDPDDIECPECPICGKDRLVEYATDAERDNEGYYATDLDADRSRTAYICGQCDVVFQPGVPALDCAICDATYPVRVGSPCPGCNAKASYYEEEQSNG